MQLFLLDEESCRKAVAYAISGVYFLSTLMSKSNNAYLLLVTVECTMTGSCTDKRLVLSLFSPSLSLTLALLFVNNPLLKKRFVLALALLVRKA